MVLDLEVLGKKEEQNFVWRGYDALLEAARVLRLFKHSGVSTVNVSTV